ncbi:MAG: LemA family protein [Candidatus Bipolaricaulia bacterium]
MGAVVVLTITVIVILLWGVFTYNRLVRLRVSAEESWRDIDTQLKRRWDLIPNLVVAVRGYADHEQEVFERVTQARARALDASNPGEQAEAEEGLKNALFSLFAVAEGYPQLKASENFLHMQRTLEQAEDAIQRARKFYNAVVRDLNMAVLTFPRTLIAAMFKFEPRDFYSLPGEDQSQAPRVRL